MKKTGGIDLPRLEFPFRGLSEDTAFEDQPEGTSRRILNVRAIDPATGMRRGSQRSGTRKVTGSGPSGSAPIKDIGETVYDEARITFSHADTPSEDWTATLPSGSGVRAIGVDLAGDVYVIDGTAKLCVFNASGTLLKSEPIPLVSTSQVVRALLVDRHTGMIFVAVSEGGKEEDARMWAYRRDNDNVVALVYEFAPNAFVERIRSRPGSLYLLQNTPSTGRAVFAAYSNYTLSPRELFRRATLYPARDFDVRQEDGAVVVTAPENTTRGTDPRYPTTKPILERDEVPWTRSEHLADYNVRVWCDLSAASLSEIEDGSEVEGVVDATGNGRSLRDIRSIPGATDRALPVLNLEGVNGTPVLHFEPGSGLTSGIAQNTNLSVQRCLLPCERNQPFASFCMIVVRLDEQDNSGSLKSVFAHGMVRRINSIVDFHYGGFYVQVRADESQIEVRVFGDMTIPTAVAGSYAFTGSSESNTYIISIAVGIPGGYPDAVDQDVVIRVNGTEIATGHIDSYSGGGLNDDRVMQEVWFFKDIESTQWNVSARDTRNWFRSWFGAGFGDITTNAEFDLVSYFALMSTVNSALGSEVSITEAEMELLEGEQAWLLGMASDLDPAHAFFDAPPDTDGTPATEIIEMLAPYASTVLYDKDRKVSWVFGTQSGGDYQGGVGQSVSFSEDGQSVYTYGPLNRGTAVPGDINNNVLVKLLSSDGSAVWRYEYDNGIGEDPLDVFGKIAVDSFDNVWIPRSFPSESAPIKGLWMIDKDGTLRIKEPLSTEFKSTAVAVPPSIPDYSKNPSTITRPEFVYIGSDEEVDGDPVLYRLRVVDAALNPNATRIRAISVVTGGDIKRVSGAATYAITGGSGALSASARYIQSTDLFSERFFTDGFSYRVYNPALGTVVPFKARSTGEVPPRCQLIASWRGAIMLARSENDPQNWHLSRRTNPYDWNIGLSPTTPDQAVSGNDTRIGRCPDIINCIIPWNDDLVILGGDKSVWRITGDPMMPNSSMDDLNVGFGLAFGQPYCRDGDGRLWVISNHGSLYVATPAGGFKRVSEKNIERRLQQIDLQTHYVRLEWDFRQEGIYIVVCPFGGTAGDVEYFLYDMKNKGFFPDNRRAAGHHAHSLAILNADRPDDRLMLFGCEDGHVRTWSELAAEDDGEPIVSSVDIGPIHVKDRDIELMSLRVQATFDSNYSGAIVSGHASSTALDIGDPVVEEYVEPGFPDNLPFRARGKFYTVRVRNAAIGRHWSLEGIEIEFAAAGPHRVRR